MEDRAAFVELRGIGKSFGTVAANVDISLRVRKGSIHAIIGENGAGKSTAMKMLYGMYRPDAGKILIRGEERSWASPKDAIAAGIGIVHQHFMLAGPYSAFENIVVGAEADVSVPRWLPRPLRFIGYSGVRRRLDALSAQYGLKVSWEKPVEELPVGVQQRIEILKLLYRDASVLILDEPTAVLTPQETAELFANLKKLAAEGKTILIITHKLKEVMALADHVTVFRAGRVVGDLPVQGTNPAELASLMVGRKVNLTVEPPPAPRTGDRVLELSNVTLRSAGGDKPVLSGINLEVRAGEIVGIAGVEGNGQSALLRLLLHPGDFKDHSSGMIRCLGQDVMGDGRPLGVGVIPEDRHREGLLLDRPVAENFLLGLQRRSSFSRRGFIRFGALSKAASHAIEEYDVRPRSLSLQAGGLSGGNQQKLIIAREFDQKPRLLIAAQPTRGVDVGAIEFIHKRIIATRTGGAGVLLVSSELDEILALSDRIVVMYAGRIVGQFSRGEASEQELGLCMGGGVS